MKRSVIKSQTKKVIMEPHKVFGLKLVFPIANNLSTQFVKRKKKQRQKTWTFFAAVQSQFPGTKGSFPQSKYPVLHQRPFGGMGFLGLGSLGSQARY